MKTKNSKIKVLKEQVKQRDKFIKKLQKFIKLNLDIEYEIDSINI